MGISSACIEKIGGVDGTEYTDTILFSIEFTWKKRELITMIRKWVGGKSRIEWSFLVLSDQFVDGVEKPTVDSDDGNHV